MKTIESLFVKVPAIALSAAVAVACVAVDQDLEDGTAGERLVLVDVDPALAVAMEAAWDCAADLHVAYREFEPAGDADALEADGVIPWPWCGYLAIGCTIGPCHLLEGCAWVSCMNNCLPNHCPPVNSDGCAH